MHLRNIKKNVQDILFDFGINVELSKNPRNHRQFLRSVNKLPININSIFDIGAFKGEWSIEAQKVFKYAQFQLFDINPYLLKNPIKLKGNFHNVLLSDTIKNVEYFRLNGTGDSYFKEKSEFYEHVTPEKIQTNTLDNIVNSSSGLIPDPDLIKIDSQGSELEIFAGAKKILKDLKVVIVELPLVEYNSGAPNFSEYTEFFINLGFFPFQLIEVHRSNKTIVQIDIAFLRNDFRHLLISKQPTLITIK